MVIHCDVCDKAVVRKELVRLHIAGVAETVNTHGDCAEVLLRCHGDFRKLPDGKLKRAILLSVGNDIEVKNTEVVITKKQRMHIISGLRISHEEGMERIHTLATIMYCLNEPDESNHEYYTINTDSQLVLMRKVVS
jgi:hypothetical protein